MSTIHQSFPQTRPMAAAGCMLGAMLLLAVVDNYVPRIAAEISVWQFLSTRAVLAVGLVAILARLGLGVLRPKRLWAVALRSALVAVGMLLYFGSLAFMPIAQSLAGLFTSPIFVLLITVFVLHQRIGPWRAIAVAIGFSGILLVLGVQDGAPGWIMLMPVFGGLFYACGSVVTRVICADEDTLCMVAGIMLVQGLIGAFALILLVIFDPIVPPGAAGFLVRGWVWPMMLSAPYVALQAVGSVAGVYLLIKAYQLGEASQVSVLEYSIMIFGPAYAWLVFGQGMGLVQIAGIALIVVAGVIIAVRSR